MATSFIAKQAEEKRRQEALGEGWDQNRSQSLLFDPLTSLRYGEFLGHAVEVGLCLSATTATSPCDVSRIQELFSRLSEKLRQAGWG